MQRIWQKNYEQDVPNEIDPHYYNSLVDLFQQSWQKYANDTAFSHLGSKMSYQTLALKSHAFAAYVQQSLNLQAGDRLAIMLPNVLQYPVAMFGALQAGLVIVNVNPLYTAAELTHVLRDSGAKAIVILENFAHVLQQARVDVAIPHVITTQVGDLFPWPKSSLINLAVKYIKKMVPAWSIPKTQSFKQVLAQGAQLNLQPVSVKREDTAYLQYTGGTTGLVKGAILSHANMVANVLQLAAWLGPLQKRYQAGREKIITALPLYHIFSLTVNCLTHVMIGAENVLISNPRDISHFIQEIKQVQFTAISGVNTLYNALLNHPDFKNVDFSRMHFSIGGGMPIQANVAERWQALTGCPLIEGYGLTEASPVVTANPLNIQKYTGNIGLPLPSTLVAIKDEAENDLPSGEIGELCVKGPQVMQGYWQNSLETANVFTQDGWLKTGDIAKMDANGYINIVDRKKDMIIVSGFKVYPNEIENVLTQHPGVLEAAVVGVPHQETGELVKAFIVKKDLELTEHDILNYCKEYLTKYKIPKKIEFMQTLPKTNVGKVLRRALRG